MKCKRRRALHGPSFGSGRCNSSRCTKSRAKGMSYNIIMGISCEFYLWTRLYSSPAQEDEGLQIKFIKARDPNICHIPTKFMFAAPTPPPLVYFPPPQCWLIPRSHAYAGHKLREFLASSSNAQKIIRSLHNVFLRNSSGQLVGWFEYFRKEGRKKTWTQRNTSK